MHCERLHGLTEVSTPYEHKFISKQKLFGNEWIWRLRNVRINYGGQLETETNLYTPENLSKY